MKESRHLSIDLGASSGRIILNIFGDSLEQKEIYRFETKQVVEGDYLVWDLRYLIDEIKVGIKMAFDLSNNIKSIGIDTWGCDYSYIDKNGNVMKNPVSYRDKRNKRGAELANKLIGKKDLYFQTGIQHMEFNTINQIVYDYHYFKEFKKVDKLLLMPDLIAYLLTGEKRIELTNLSTMQIYNPAEKRIIKISNDFDIESLLPEIIRPGEKYGYIKKEIAEELGIPNVAVIAVCSHDTASAIFSLNLNSGNAYLSSGTWSLLGILNKEPIINEKSLSANFSNEIGYNHEIRFLKNIQGFWVKNLLYKQFGIEENIENFKLIDKNIVNNLNFTSVVDLDHELFNSSNNMINNFDKYFENTYQKKPRNYLDYLTSFNYSLVCKYKEQINSLEVITGKKINSLTVIGGGAANDLINQMTANILKIPVIKGEVEATSIGNALIQYMSLNGIDEDRAKEKYMDKEVIIYYPNEDIEEVYKKYLNIIKGGGKNE